MYLKQIELLGFKSFPTKTQVRFSHGVTSIVGPNGCGKTNILDALRWVLGEQKPTLLRGGKMEEVIFNGTRDMKPLGMSEVTLTVVNNRGVLPTEYHEIQITRRLFRSGDSEYLLNKVPCRLKDITDLFVDTGMGPHSYSVIQQHMIDSVISDKAEERRFLFEEAAGITKYKQRRKAAMRKMEATENDFLRLKDVYAEVKTRVNSLYRQHKKAERYQKLQDLIRNWDLYLASQRIRKLSQDKREVKAEFDRLSDEKAKRGTTLDSVTGELEADRNDLLTVERQLTQVGNEVYSISETAHGLEREISVLKEKKSNAIELIAKNEADLADFDTRTAQLNEEKQAAEEQKAVQNVEMEKLEAELAAAQTEQGRSDQALMDARQGRETENRKLFDLESRLSSGKAEESSLREQTEELADMANQVETGISQSSAKQTDLIAQVEIERQRLDRLTAERTDLEERKKQLTAQIETGIERGEELALELSNLKASLEACEARRNLLEDMMLHYEGHESGVVAAMEAREQWPQLVGTVADCFVPVEGMELVLETALGEMSRFLICRDRSSAEQIIGHLRSEGKGRVGILVPMSGSLTPAVKRPEIDTLGVVGWLDGLVTTEEPLRPLMEAVLSRTLIIKPEADIDEILKHLPYGFGVVSTEGVLFRNNLIAGGSTDDFPLFRRKEKVAEQETEITTLGDKISSVENSKHRLTAEMAEHRANSGQATARLSELLEEQETQQKRLSEAEFDHRSLATELERLTREKQSLNERLEKVRGRQYSLGLNAEGLAGEKESLIQNVQQAGDHLEKMESAAASATSEVSRLQVAGIEARSRVEQSGHRLNHLTELIEDIERTRATRQNEITQAKSDITHADTTLERQEQELKRSFERRDEKSAVQDQLRVKQTELMSVTTDKENRAKQIRLEKDSVSENLHKADIQLTAIESEIKSLSERLQQDYEVDISQLQVERPVEKKTEFTDEEAPTYVGELKEKLKNFGAVNLLALEEYEVAAERETFLSAQLADLTKAKNDLRSTITKINQTACQLFNESFAKVQKNFSDLFVDLFAGGEAHISLVDPDDPLESDVEIIARPGGKKLLPITMLSGGERALTAISLLFSLYLVKPSPFCILDEIDAPLDDANCQRFLKIIRSFSQQTQFIIITHNKITMEAADNLYGVTMERPGVSKLVAVRFATGADGTAEELVEIEHDELSEEMVPGLEGLPEAIQDRINPAVTVNPGEDDNPDS